MAFRSNDIDGNSIITKPAGATVSTPFTIMTWVNQYGTNTGTIISTWSTSGNANRAWRLEIDSTLFVEGDISFNGKTSLQTTGPTAVSLNTWHHIGMDFDGSNVRIFLNAAVDITAALIGTIFASTFDFAIGGYDDGSVGSSSQPDALIEDVRYYDRILDLAEWQTIHATKGRDGITHGLVTRWMLDELPPGVAMSASDPRDSGPGQFSIDRVVGVSPRYIEGEVHSLRRAS